MPAFQPRNKNLHKTTSGGQKKKLLKFTLVCSNRAVIKYFL